MRPGQEVGHDAGVELSLALLAPVEEVDADLSEAALELGDEVERVVCEDPIGAFGGPVTTTAFGAIRTPPIDGPSPR